MVKTLGYLDRMIVLIKPFDKIEVSQLAVAMSEKWRLKPTGQVSRGQSRANNQMRPFALKVHYA
jgi:hypothetical protein